MLIPSSFQPTLRNSCVFNTVDQAVSMLLEEDYQPEVYRKIIEEKFSLDVQLSKLDSLVLGEARPPEEKEPQRFRIVLEEGDPKRLSSAVTAYLQAFTANDEVELRVLAPKDIAPVYSVVTEVLSRLGLNAEEIPDIILEEDALTRRCDFIKTADLVLGSAATLAEARDRRRPALQSPSAEGLRLAQSHFRSMKWAVEALPTAHLEPERWLLMRSENWEEVLSAYLKEVPATHRISLLIRVQPGTAEAFMAQIMAWAEARGIDPNQLPDIVLVDDEVPSEIAVYRMATTLIDAGDPLHRTVAEALGLAVVPKDAPGMAQFIANPFISILIPTYNRAAFIYEALNSARFQNYPRFEVLVLDDGSTDDTAAIIDKVRDPRVHYLYKPHSGGPATRNFGLKYATGEYVLWLDSDDVIEPDVLSDYVNAWKRNPELDVIYGDLWVTDRNLNPTWVLSYENWYQRNAELIAGFVESCLIPNGGTLIRKDCYEWIGGYNEQFYRAHDYEWWSRLVGKAKFWKVDRIVYRWRWHGGNMSSGTVKCDLSYEAAVVKGMMERYSLQELCPDLDWDNLPKNEVEARALLRIARKLLVYEDRLGALEILRRCMDLSPVSEVEELVLLLDGQ